MKYNKTSLPNNKAHISYILGNGLLGGASKKKGCWRLQFSYLGGHDIFRDSDLFILL